MAEQILTNLSTQSKLDQYLANPAQVLLLVGHLDSQKNDIAKQLSASLLNTPKSKLETNPNYIYIQKKEDLQNITIDDIRSLKTAIKLRSSASTSAKRVILIEDANYMNLEAQNSLLKALEEPADGTFYILTSNTTSSLLPTILSRCVAIRIRPVSLESAKKYYSSHDPTVLQSAWHLSGGETGLLMDLLSDDSHNLKMSVNQAKEFLHMPRFERFLELDKISSNKNSALEFIDALSRVVRALYIHSVNSEVDDSAMKILLNAKLLIKTKSDIFSNVNLRLSMMNLTLSLSI